MTGRLPRSRGPLTGLTLTALVAAALTGCVALPDDPTDGLTPEPEDATPRTLWLTGDAGSADAGGGLTGTQPTGESPQAVPSGNFFTRWGSDSAYAQFVGVPLEDALLVTGNVTITGFARADGPAAQAGVFPHFIAYFGTDLALNADGSANADPVLLPGNVVQFEATLNLPPDGLVLEAGFRPRVLLVSVMTQDDAAGDVAFLANATATPARVEFDAKPITLPTPAAGGSPQENPGTLTGSAYAATREGASQATHPLGVPAGSAYAELVLQVEDSAGFGDIDLAVWSEAGDFVARSVTPFGHEVIRLYPGQFPADGGYFDVTVTNYGSAAASYTLSVDTVPIAHPAP